MEDRITTIKEKAKEVWAKHKLKIALFGVTVAGLVIVNRTQQKEDYSEGYVGIITDDGVNHSEDWKFRYGGTERTWSLSGPRREDALVYSYVAEGFKESETKPEEETKELEPETVE